MGRTVPKVGIVQFFAVPIYMQNPNVTRSLELIFFNQFGGTR